MPYTFGTQPSDTVTNSRGDVVAGVAVSLYDTEVAANAGTGPVASVTTNAQGRWPYTDATRPMLWVRTPTGDVYPVLSPEGVLSSASAVAGLTASIADKATVAALAAEAVTARAGEAAAISAGGAVSSVAGRTGAVALASADLTDKAAFAATFDAAGSAAAVSTGSIGAVALTGGQTVAGLKNFTTAPTVNGAPISQMTDAQLATAVNTGTTKTQLSSTFVGLAASSYGMLSGANGVVGNGVADDGPALNTLLATAAAARVPVVLTANTVIFTTVKIVIPSNTRLNGNGATIKCGITSSIYEPTIGLSNVSNVIIENLTVDGNKAAYAPVTESKHGIALVTATDVLIRNCTLNNNKGDGINLAGDNATTWSERVTLENLVCHYNHRNGLSVISARTVRVIGGSYSYSTGTAPQVGIDIEPNNAADVIDDLVFSAVTVKANTSSGLSILLHTTPTARQGGVVFIGCAFNANTGAGVDLVTTYHTTFTDCHMDDNVLSGVSTGTKVNHLTIRGGTVLRNGYRGIFGVSPTMNDWLISGVRILDNVGYAVMFTGTGARFTVKDCVIGNDTTMATQYGISSVAAMTNVSILNNDVRTPTSMSLEQLADQATTRTVSGNKGWAIARAVTLADVIAALTAAGITA